MLLSRRMVVAAAVATLLAAAGPSPDTVLTVEGAEPVHLTREALAAMPQVEIVQETAYTDGVATFAGPLARDVLRPPAGATVAVLIALNDYSIEIPVEDFERHDAILAIALNGQPLSRRDKGPIWLMYPLGKIAENEQRIYDNRLIWQLRTVTFR